MALSIKQVKFVELWFEGELTLAQIAAKLNVAERTLYRWKLEAEVANYHEQLVQARVKETRAVVANAAKRAAQALLLFLQTREVRDKKGNLIRIEFLYPKQARLAAADILQALGLNVKPESTSVLQDNRQQSSVVVYLPEKEEVPEESHEIEPSDSDMEVKES